jgi:hypothetical protein
MAFVRALIAGRTCWIFIRTTGVFRRWFSRKMKQIFHTHCTFLQVIRFWKAIIRKCVNQLEFLRYVQISWVISSDIRGVWIEDRKRAQSFILVFFCMFMSDVTNESVVKLFVMFTQCLCRLLHWRGICSVLELVSLWTIFKNKHTVSKTGPVPVLSWKCSEASSHVGQDRKLFSQSAVGPNR